MVEFSARLACGPKADKIKKTLIKKLKKGKSVPFLYVVYISESKTDQLEIVESMQIGLPFFEERDLYIAGLAIGEDEALELIRQMVDTVYTETGSTDIKAYFRV